MAANPSFKVNQIAKDMGLKSKDLLDLLTDKGIDAKSQVSLEPTQFEILFNALTKSNQVNGIEDYIDGITYIPSKKKVSVPMPEESEKEADNATAEAEVKPAEEKVAEPEKPTKAAKSESSKTEETAKAHDIADSKAGVNNNNNNSNSSNVDAAVSASEPKKAPAKTPYPPKSNTAQGNMNQAAGARPANQRPTQNGNGNNGYGASQQYQPRNNQNNYTPNPNYQQGQYQPRNTQSGYGAGAGSSFAPKGDFAPRGDFAQRGDFTQRGDRTQQRSSRPQGRPDPKSNNNNKDFFNDKGGNQNAPKERFQAVAIVRGQTPKGTDVKQKGGTRIVDTRGGSVDLSKYDDKFESFAPDDMSNARGENTKLRKGQPQIRQNQNSPFQKSKKPQKNVQMQQPKKVLPTNATIPDEIMVSDFASRIKTTTAEVIKRLMLMGMMVTANQTIDFDTAAIVADELGVNVTKEVVVTIEEKLFEDTEDNAETLVERAPVVCVMGHVDHGKTSILDAIRNTNVTSGEAGGITQHIGAYRVKVKGKDITFLDTPGHEAFTAMRARGAMATDIAILVVAADDGIMPQTVEAINHAKAAGIDIIVAINKMDKPSANPEAVKQELTKYDLVPEEWGGDVICVPVSALTKQGIDDLLESVLLVAEVKELKANPNRRAKGIVIEAKLDKGRGPVATVLVQNGTLHAGDTVIAGTAVGRVRAMTDHTGKMLKSAAPSVPVEIIGLSEVPLAGDEFNAVEDERMARELADKRKNNAKEAEFKANARANLNDLFAQISEGVKDLNIVVKADVGGSVEAVKQSLIKISNDQVRVSVIHAAVGGITEGDVTFAAASNAIIVGFNVRPDKAALDLAERQGVDIRTYRIIYECIEEITAAMKGMLAPTFKENLLGHIEVRDTIHVPSVGTIAGSYVLDGKVTRTSQIRIVRDGIVIFEDKIASLRRFKDDVREVAQGYECGIALEKFDDIKIGDILEAFVMEQIENQN